MSFDFKKKSEEIARELEMWAKENDLISPGSVIVVNIEIRNTPCVVVKMANPHRAKRRGKFYRTTQKVTESDFKLILKHISIFNGQQADLLRALARTNNRPVDATCLTSKSTKNRMNTLFISAGLNFRVVAHPYGSSWKHSRLLLCHVKPSHKKTQ